MPRSPNPKYRAMYELEAHFAVEDQPKYLTVYEVANAGAFTPPATVVLSIWPR